MTTNGNDEAAVAKAPSLNVIAQYVKDLSFENPNAPVALAGQTGGPSIQIQVNVGARQMSETDLEVELKLNVDANSDGKPMFKAELVYGGIFRVENVTEKDRHPIALIECPRLLFPFARQILADAVRNGGYPPLLIDPIDFVALYRQRVQQASQAGAAPQSLAN